MAIFFLKNYEIPNEPWETRPDLHVFQYNQANHELPASPKPPREDIQLALTVIGRRSEKAISMEPWGLINLRSAYLVRADLRGARLPNAQLSGTQLNRANLFDAQLNGAKFLTKRATRRFGYGFGFYRCHHHPRTVA